MTVLLLAALLHAQTANAPSPCSAPEFRQFDFWVGDWDVHGPKGKPVGTSRVERIENGCGVLEQWTSAAGGTGRSLNVYDAARRSWLQAWAGSNGLTLVLRGTFEGGKMVLTGESLGPKGERVNDRVTWSRFDDGKVRQLWEQSRDGGTTWSVAFDGTYSRRPGASSKRIARVP